MIISSEDFGGTPNFWETPRHFPHQKAAMKKPHLDGFRHSHEGPIDGLPGFASRQGGGSFGTQRFNGKVMGKNVGGLLFSRGHWSLYNAS